MIQRSSALLAALAVLAWASPGRADEPIVLQYEAGDACPTRAELEAEVQARTPLAHFVDRSGPGQRAFRVTITVDRSGAVGTLETHAAPPSDATAERTVFGRRCADVVAALALVAALAIDPHASIAPSAAPSPRPVVPDAVPMAAAIDPPAPERIEAPPRAAHAARVLDVGASAAVVATFGLATQPLAGVRLAASVERASRGRWARPSFALGGSYASSGPFDGSAPVGALSYFTGDAEICPTGFRPTAALTLRPCGAAAAGAVRSRGVAVAHPDTETNLWLEGRALGIVTLSRGPFDVALRGGALLPITRPTFVFRTPRLVVHDTPFLAAFVGIGAGGRF